MSQDFGEEKEEGFSIFAALCISRRERPKYVPVSEAGYA